MTARARPRAWLRLGTAALLASATALLYAPAVDHGFVNYDDNFLITENAALGQGLSAEGLRWALRDTSHANWMPLTRLSYLADQELHGLSAAGVHATHVALHAASVALLFLALVRMTRALGPSAFVAALFAVHPLGVESVAWAAERKGLLAGLFWMLALWIYAGVGQRPLSWGRGLAVTLALAACLMSKAVGVTLFAVLLLLDVWPLRRIRFGSEEGGPGVGPVRAAAEKLPLVALAAASAAITVLTQSEAAATATIEQLPIGARVSNAAVSYVGYLARFVWPTRLSVFYPHPESVPVLPVLAAGTLLAALSALALWQLRRRPWLAVGWLWFLGVLVPMIGLVQVGSQASADRYAYLPLVGLALAVAWSGAEGFARSGRLRAAVPVAALAVLAALALGTRSQLRHWHSSEALFTHSVAVTERNHVAHAQLGSALLQAGRPAEAIAELRESLRIRPHSLEIANNLAWLLSTHPDPALRDPDEAVRLARGAAKQAGGRDARVLDTFAAAQAAAGRYDRAIWYAGRARQVARARGEDELAREIATRLALYRAEQPYREDPNHRESSLDRPAAPAR